MKFNKKLLYFIVLGLILIVLATTIYSSVNLLNSREGYSALSFVEHASLPRQIELNESFFFIYNVSNNEGRRKTYDVKSYFISDKETILINEELITLENNEKRIIHESYIFHHSFHEGMILITIPESDLDINFKVFEIVE